MGVGSKFSFEECRRYADHLHATGQGVRNPGGFARSIHRSGEEDGEIERFLRGDYSAAVGPGASLAERNAAAVAEILLEADLATCPDCRGSLWRPVAGADDYSKGVVKCRHERLERRGAA